MNKWIALFAGAIGLCVSLAPAQDAETRHKDAAQSAAVEWLSLVDAGKYVESWEQMAPGFKNEVSKRKWKSTAAKIREPLGKSTSRKLKSADYSKELPGAPEGEYVILEYESVFEKKPSALEKISLSLGPDLNWRVSSYNVK